MAITLTELVLLTLLADFIFRKLKVPGLVEQTVGPVLSLRSLV